MSKTRPVPVFEVGDSVAVKRFPSRHKGLFDGHIGEPAVVADIKIWSYGHKHYLIQFESGGQLHVAGSYLKAR